MRTTKILRHVAVSIALLFLAACASTNSISDGASVSPAKGIVAFKVTTNIRHGQLQYKKFTALETSESLMKEYFVGPDESVVVEAGEKYWLMPVAPGDYMWSKVIGESRRQASFHSSNRFSVAPGKITYVGHIDVTTDNEMVRISIEDNEADMVRHIRTHYPVYFSSMEIEKSVTEFRR